MKKLCIILSIVLCLSLLGGCSVDITIHDENGSSIPLADDVESIVNSLISDSTTTTTVPNDESSTNVVAASTSTAATTATQSKTGKTTGKTSASTQKPSSSATKTTTASKTNAPSATTTKKDHHTPNINGTFHDDMADAVLLMLNKARKESGLGELTMDTGNMMTAAKIRAKEITVHWAHERPDKDRWDTVFDEEGVKYNARGENLADGHRSAEEVFKAWMDSPGHKANIMEPRFTHISIVCLEHEGHFYWVQLFGANVKR